MLGAAGPAIAGLYWGEKTVTPSHLLIATIEVFSLQPDG